MKQARSSGPASVKSTPPPGNSAGRDDVGAFGVGDGALERVWFDRDLSWLEFNRRVLAEALDDRTPLLERVKFLAIFSANLDEFFMKRMALLRETRQRSDTS